MKNLIRIVATFSLAALVALVGCKGDDNGATDDGGDVEATSQPADGATDTDGSDDGGGE